MIVSLRFQSFLKKLLRYHISQTSWEMCTVYFGDEAGKGKGKLQTTEAGLWLFQD